MVVKIGTCSWTDPTLLKAGWYPAEADSAEARLAHYASRFPVVEVDSTYYSLPSERNAALWAERTPPGFTFDVKAFSLMTGHGTALAKLPPILRDSLPQPAAGKAGNLYLKDLPPEAQRWIWQAFDDALAPLAQAGKLGAILLQFPPWFAISRENKRYLEQCREMLPQRRLAVEFRQRSWLEERNAQETLTFLAQNDLSYVCVDEPQGFRSSIPPPDRRHQPGPHRGPLPRAQPGELGGPGGSPPRSASATSTRSRSWPSGCPASGRSRRRPARPTSCSTTATRTSACATRPTWPASSSWRTCGGPRGPPGASGHKAS